MLCPTHLPTLDDLNNICRTVSIVKLITMLFYLSPSPLLPLLQIFPSTSVCVESVSWSVNSPALHTTQRFVFLFTSASRIQSTTTLSLCLFIRYPIKGRHLPTSKPNPSITPSNVLPHIPLQSSHHVHREVFSDSHVVISISNERFGLLDISPRDWTGM
jgi:hypothetical protein